jgi:hypothetical protein
MIAFRSFVIIATQSMKISNISLGISCEIAPYLKLSKQLVVGRQRSYVLFYVYVSGKIKDNFKNLIFNLFD